MCILLSNLDGLHQDHRCEHPTDHKANCNRDGVSLHEQLPLDQLHAYLSGEMMSALGHEPTNLQPSGTSALHPPSGHRS
jgi:hypothetical protein